MAKQPSAQHRTETRDQAVARRLAEMVAQKEWTLVQAGRSLHDDLGQILTATGIQFDLLAGDSKTLEPALAARLATIQELLEECNLRTRALSKQMSRSTVDRLGLPSALDRAKDRWEPGFAGAISIECPGIRLAPNAARAVMALVDHALELACNRISCTWAAVAVLFEGEGIIAQVTLQNLNDPFLQLEDEVRWHVVRAACRLAGGEAEIAFHSGNDTILSARFNSKTF